MRLDGMTPEVAAKLLGVSPEASADTIASAYEARDHDVVQRLRAEGAPLQQAKYRQVREQLAAARDALLEVFDAGATVHYEPEPTPPRPKRNTPVLPIEVHAAKAKPERSWIVRIGGTFVLVCFALVGYGLITEKRGARNAQAEKISLSDFVQGHADAECLRERRCGTLGISVDRCEIENGKCLGEYCQDLVPLAWLTRCTAAVEQLPCDGATGWQLPWQCNIGNLLQEALRDAK